MANTMGAKSFVCCYAVLNADDRPYAGFPAGIAQGTTLGTFLGRQADRFLRDLGFDYLWLSNGFGFGLETVAADGPAVRRDAFRRDQRPGDSREGPRLFGGTSTPSAALPVEVRGTNLGTGADLATDAVPLREISRGPVRPADSRRRTAPGPP